MNSLCSVPVVLCSELPSRAVMDIDEERRDESWQPLGGQMGEVEASVMVAP